MCDETEMIRPALTLLDKNVHCCDHQIAMKINFPTLASGLIVFSLVSGACAATTPLVSHGEVWRYHLGTNAPQSGWTSLADASLDATWATGNGGFGYADGGGQETNNCLTLLSDMKNRYTTVYIRKEFTVTTAAGGQ